MTEFDPTLQGEQDYRKRGYSRSRYVSDRNRWMQQRAQAEGYKGNRFMFQPKGYNKIWKYGSAQQGKYYWKPDKFIHNQQDIAKPWAVYDENKPETSYWNNSKNVRQWHTFLGLQDKNYVPPEWLDKENVNRMYDDLKVYNPDEKTWGDEAPQFGTEASYLAQITPQPPQDYKIENSIADVSLPPELASLKTDIDEYNKIIKQAENDKKLEYSQLIKAQNFLKHYNLGMENLKLTDEELFNKLGGLLDVESVEQMYNLSQDEEFDWNDLEPWQRFLGGTFGAGEMKNKTSASTITAAMFSAGQAGLASAAITGAIGALAFAKIPALATGAVTGGVGTAIVGAVSIALGAALGIYQYSRIMSGNTNKNALDRIFEVFGALGEGTERVIGTAVQVKERGFDEVFGTTEDFMATWRAGSLYYDTGGLNGVGDWVTDSVSKTAWALNQVGIGKDWSSGMTTKAGEVWQFVKGYDKPQSVGVWGASAVNEAYKELRELGDKPDIESIQLILAKWQDKYGFSGSMTNLIGQIFLDPMNFVSGAVDSALAKNAKFKLASLDPSDLVKRSKYMAILKGAEQAKGNWLADTLPFPIQGAWDRLADSITGNKGYVNIGDGILRLKSNQSPINVLTYAKASGMTSIISRELLSELTRVTIEGTDGTLVTGQLQDQGRFNYNLNGVYKVKDDFNNTYELNDSLDVVRGYDSQGKPIQFQGKATSKFDKVAIETLTKAIVQANIDIAAEELAKIATPSNNLFIKWFSLTPKSRVQNASQILTKNIIDMVSFSENNAKNFVNLVKYYAGTIADTSAVGEAAKVYGVGGTVGLASNSLKHWVEGEGFTEMIDSFFDNGAIIKRAKIGELAKKIGVEVGDIVGTNPKLKAEEIFNKLNAVDPAVAGNHTLVEIDDLLKPFVGKDALPVNDSQFIAKASVNLVESAEKFLIKQAGVTELGALTRLQQLLKQAFGVSAISLNVSTWITNFFTNEVTTSLMIGGGTFMRKSSIEKMYARMGYSPKDIEQIAGTNFGLSAEIAQANSELFKILNPRKSWITKASGGLTKILDKTPILNKFTAAYSNIEDFSRSRAMAGAIKLAMTVELSEIPADRLAVLRTRFTDVEINAMRKLAASAYSPDELMNKFITGVEYHSLAEDAIEGMFVEISNGDQDSRNMLQDLFDKTELGDWLRERLPKCKTPEDVEDFRKEFYEKWNDSIDLMRGGMIAGDVGNTGADIYKALNNAYQHEYTTQRYLSEKWDEVVERMSNTKDDALRSEMFRNMRTRQHEVWDRTWAYIVKFSTDAINKAGKGEFADRYSAIVWKRALGSKEYFDALDKIHEKYFTQEKKAWAEGHYTKKAMTKDIADLTTKWRDDMFQYEKQQGDLWVEMVGSTGKSINGLEGNALTAAARKFIDAHLKRKDALRRAVDAHYKRISAMGIEKRRQQNHEFFTKVYQPMVARINSALVDDYYKMFHKPITSQTEIPETSPRQAPKSPAPKTEEIPLPEHLVEVEANGIRNESKLENFRVHKVAEDVAHGITAKNSVEAGLGLSNAQPEQIKSLTALMRAVAETWADVTGRNYNEWYGEYFGGFEKIDVDTLNDGLGSAGIHWDDNKAFISFTKSSNLTSAAHEVKHVYLRMVADLYRKGISTDLEVVAREFGGIEANEFLRLIEAADSKNISEQDAETYKKISEAFVDGATKWELNDVPLSMKSLFKNFIDFIMKLLKGAKKTFNIELSDNMKEVYKNLYNKYSDLNVLETKKQNILKAREGTVKLVYGTENTPYEVVPIIVEYDWLTRSHQLDGTINKVYPQQYQPREYRTDFVETNARKLIPDKMLEYVMNFSDGAMIVSDEGFILVGNHRSGFLGVAMDRYPERYNDYKSRLARADLLSEYGLSQKDLVGINDPVLVYKVKNPADIDAIVKDANTPNQQQFAKYENAVRRANAIPTFAMTDFKIPEGMSLDQAIRLSNSAIKHAFRETLGKSEVGQYIDANDNLTDQGVAAIKDMIAAYSFKDSDNGKAFLKIALTNRDTILSNIMDSMIELSPGIARIEALILDGQLDATYSVADSLSNAAIRYTEWVNSGRAVPVDQEGLFAIHRFTPTEKKFLHLFDNYGRSKKYITALIRDIIDSTITASEANPEQTTLFGVPSVMKPDEILNAKLDTALGLAAKEVKTITDIRKRQVIDALSTKPVSEWDVAYSKMMEVRLKAMLKQITPTPQEPPEWMNVKGLFSGDIKDYTAVRKTIKGLIDERTTGKVSKYANRELIVQQAFMDLIGESAILRSMLGIEHTPESYKAQSDTLFQKVSEVVDMPFVDGQLHLTELVKELRELWESAQTDKVKLPESFNNTLAKAQQISKPISENDAAVYTARSTLLQSATETIPSDDDWYYSAALRAAEGIPQEKLTVDQARAYLKNGVKQEELDNLGVDFLFAGRDKITKTELVDFIRANQIHVEEVIDDKAWKSVNVDLNNVDIPASNYKSLILSYDAGGNYFTSEHWTKKYGIFGSVEVDNPIAHVRFEDRFTALPDGRDVRTLNIIEIQSDTAKDVAQELFNKLGFTPGIDVPFHEPHLLVFKRMLRYAVDNGYEVMTFPAGEYAAKVEHTFDNRFDWAYDKVYVNDFNKYLKKFGTRVDEQGILGGKELGKSHSVVINDQIKQAVGKGQPLYQAMSEVPMGGNPTPRQDWAGWNEVVNQELDPEFNSVMDNFIKKMGDPEMKLNFDNLDGKVAAALGAQAKTWSEDVKIKKSTALNFGKAMVDHSLLDYTQKTGLDDLLSSIFPYQFWFSQSLVEWAKAVATKPSIAANYYKYMETLRRNGIKGLPARFAGKNPIFAAWLPDELGDTLWVNPRAKLFPLEVLTQPLTNPTDTNESLAETAINYINQQAKDGEITTEDARNALATREGKVWQDAAAYAITNNKEATDPMNALSWSMIPAVWFTIPYYMLSNQKDKIAVFPHTRQAQAIGSYADEGGLVGLIGQLGKAVAAPEMKIREIVGLSPYGEYGDYYIEFMLSNLATSGRYSIETIITAMLEKSGDAYEEAKELADEYLSFRLPGSALLNVLSHGDAQLDYVGVAMLATMFPAGMYPKGELEQRGLSKQYSKAWDDFLLGDNTAMLKFYDENPEYEARLALFKEPEERLQAHLINLLWDKYYTLSDPDRKLVKDQFGIAFQQYFINSDTRDYTQLDSKTLAYWNRQLGNKVPNNQDTKEAMENTLVPLELYDADIAAAGQQFIDLRQELFPNSFWQQNLYYKLPEGERNIVLNKYPDLVKYWDWKDEMANNNPALASYLEDQANRYDGSDATHYGVESPTDEAFINWDAELIADVSLYALNGTPLSSGAKAELNRLWIGMGKPGGDLYLWIEAYLGIP